MHMAKMQHSELLQLMIAYFSRDIKLNDARHKVSGFGARIVYKIITYFSAGEYAHLFDHACQCQRLVCFCSNPLRTFLHCFNKWILL